MIKQFVSKCIINSMTAQLYDHQEINFINSSKTDFAASHQEIIDVRCMVLAGQLYFSQKRIVRLKRNGSYPTSEQKKISRCIGNGFIIE